MTIRSRLWHRLWLVLAVTLGLPLAAHAVGSGPASVPETAPSAEAEYNKGLQAKAGKRLQEAIGDFRRALDLRPNFPEAWNELGFALRQVGQYAEAVKAYNQALRLRPNFPEALEYLGEAYVNPDPKLRAWPPGSGRGFGEAHKQSVLPDLHGLYRGPMGTTGKSQNTQEPRPLLAIWPRAFFRIGVKLGRVEEARAILKRLTPMDRARAQELEEAIRAGR